MSHYKHNTCADYSSDAGAYLNLEMPSASTDSIDNTINIDSSIFELCPDERIPVLDATCLEYPDVSDPFADPFRVTATDFHSMAQRDPCANDFDPLDYALWNMGPSKSTPALVTHSMQLLFRVIRTWPKTLAKEVQAPPMFHPFNTEPSTMLWPMVKCVAVAKLWAGQPKGTADIVRQAVLQEMRLLLGQVRQCDMPPLYINLRVGSTT
jgi:hypothetical protein